MVLGDVWLFRIVHQDTGKPAQGVPVTVLDRAGNAAGHWVSDADGIVAVPRRDIPKLRLRVGLRSEDPIELTTATLGDEPTPLAAPSQLPPTTGGTGGGGRGWRVRTARGGARLTGESARCRLPPAWSARGGSATSAPRCGRSWSST